MRRTLRYFILVSLTLWLLACASGSGGRAVQGRDYFPGGSPSYDWGISQSKENFANVERAQSDYRLYTTQRTWIDFQPSVRASATIIGLYAYYPLDVRWKLKDGREFILEGIDVRAIMREYFKSHDIPLQWQREGRPKAKSGDVGPLLTFEVKDDTVRIKWVIKINHTPVDQRLTAKGAATYWDVTAEEHLVTTIEGAPARGIDFNKKWEFKTPTPK